MVGKEVRTTREKAERVYDSLGARVDDIPWEDDEAEIVYEFEDEIEASLTRAVLGER